MEKQEHPVCSDFKLLHPIEVRFRDLDAMGHVNNAVYFTYFENARAAYVKAIGHQPSPAGSMTERFPFIMLKIECQYLAPATLEDKLLVCLRTSSVGTKSFAFDYLLVDDNRRELARGSSVQVFYDYDSGQTRPVPDWFRKLLEEYERS